MSIGLGAVGSLRPEESLPPLYLEVDIKVPGASQSVVRVSPVSLCQIIFPNPQVPRNTQVVST